MSPFKLNDRIEDISSSKQGFATVTEITERGFKYTLDKRYIAHARLNISWTEANNIVIWQNIM